MLETTASSLRELAYKYREFNLANVGGREKIQQDYLKPKVKELLRQFSKIAGIVVTSLCISMLFT